MSKFLGKIHFWLFNKIKYAEGLELEIEGWAKVQGKFPVDRWVVELSEKYGAPVGGEELENIIDTGNIHGWLQSKIKGTELRTAQLITNILKFDEGYKAELENIFRLNGKQKGEESKEFYSLNVPADVYKVINDFILEGMPCDPIDKKLQDDEEEYRWLTSYCIHEQYWKTVEGDINHFYDFRKVWLESFVSALSDEFKYEMDILDQKRLNIIRRVL